MREIVLKEPVELSLAAQQNMMLVLRLTTAGVIARAGLTVDRMDDVKLAVEEACGCMIDNPNGPKRLRLRFWEETDALKISICSACDCVGVLVGEDERTVVKCILESLVDGVEVRMCGDVVAAIELKVDLNR